MTPDLPLTLVVLLTLVAGQGVHPAHAQGVRNSEPSPADNTNTDRGSTRPPGVLAQDRWNTSEDLRITQNIRDGLSRKVLDSDVGAIAIRTDHGAVTLSGPVHDTDERRAIGALAKGTPGTRILRNELSLR